MEIDRQLSRTMLTLHPQESSRILETLDAPGAAAVLLDLEPGRAAEVLRYMVRPAAAAVVSALPSGQAGEVLAALPIDAAAHILRLLDGPPRGALLAAVPERLARALQPMLRFSEGTAGMLMDPNVLMLPRDLRVSQALKRVRRQPENAQDLLPVVDQHQVLTGLVPLTALLIAPPETRLEALERPAHHKLPTTAGLAVIREHPGWREAATLPVVDDRGVLIGVLDSQRLRRLEEEHRVVEQDTETVRALGELFRAGFGALLGSVLAVPAESPTSRRTLP